MSTKLTPRITQVTLTPGTLYDAMAWTITVLDEAAREFLEVRELDTGGAVRIDAGEWPALRDQIDQMFVNIAKGAQPPTGWTRWWSYEGAKCPVELEDKRVVTTVLDQAATGTVPPDTAARLGKVFNWGLAPTEKTAILWYKVIEQSEDPLDASSVCMGDPDEPIKAGCEWDEDDEDAPYDPPDGWIPWNGGDMPVHGHDMVHYRMRSGDVATHGECAGDLTWNHCGSTYDIIAYKVVG